MYTTFYGFTDLPFNNTPDPDFFFMSPGHQRALLFLLYAIREKKGLITVTGKAGTGKTALLQVIQREIGQAVKMVFFLDTGAGLPVLLGHILEKIGICCQDPSKDSFELLREGLLHHIQQGISVVLVVDEAHGLEWRQLEQIRLLLNLETTDQKLLQIVLIGQPELQNKLNQPTVQQLKQRVDLSCRIDPLSKSESFQYIEYRLKRAGRDQQDIFSYEALQEVYRRSQGIPRLINNFCDKALLLGFTRQQLYIDHDTVQELFSLFESTDGKPAQSRLIRKDDDQLHLADREYHQEYYQEYQMVNAGKRTHPFPAQGGDEVWKFLHDGLRTVLGQQGRRQPQGRDSGVCAGREDASEIKGRLPDSPAGEANHYQGLNHNQQGNPGHSAYPNGSGPKESTPKESDQNESSPNESNSNESNSKAGEPIKRKPLSPEYIKQFESLNIFSSDKSQGHMLKRCLHFLPNLLIRNSRRLMGLNGKKFSFPTKVLEEYQRIKDNLYQANPLNKAQTLVFSSSNSGEGTSTVAINFAVTVAMTEESKILLVDANFRAPKLHKFFSLPKSEGLGEIIREKINWKDSLRSCKIPNLSIITAGDVGLNPVHLLKSAVLERTIQEFTEHFDHILFDTCPISDYSDPILLGSQTDGLILVVQAGKTRMEVVQRSKKILHGAVPILGIVLNRRSHYIPDAIYRRL